MLSIEYDITVSSNSCFDTIISYIRSICEIINLNISSIESYINIFCEILTAILLVWGCIAVKKIRDKKVDATTDFYSKLKVHLLHLKKQLGTEEFTVLNYLYDDPILEHSNLQKPTDYKTFLDVINSLLSFLKSSDNQVLPSLNFFNNLRQLVEKLSEYTLIPEFHPFSDLAKGEVKKELDNLQAIINDLINEIECEQKELFQKLWANMK